MKQVFFILPLIFIFTSCIIAIPEPIENYKGDIIYGKHNPPIGMCFEVKHKNKDGKYDFKTIYVLEFDWNKYNIGDTIK